MIFSSMPCPGKPLIKPPNPIIEAILSVQDVHPVVKNPSIHQNIPVVVCFVEVFLNILILHMCSAINNPINTTMKIEITMYVYAYIGQKFQNNKS